MKLLLACFSVLLVVSSCSLVLIGPVSAQIASHAAQTASINRYARTLDLCVGPFGVCFGADFRVSISYSAPSSAKQGEIIAASVKIAYLREYDRYGPLDLDRVSVALRSDPGGEDIVSSVDSSPPSLKVGSQYTRDFELNLTDHPEKPGKYYLALVWSISDVLPWDTGEEDPSGVKAKMSLTLLSGVDTDEDGLFDPVELRMGTDPKNSDTDGDGLNDSDEVNMHRSNPLLKDTDGDGLSDGEEVQTYGTNQLEKDTDGDGLIDGEEIEAYHTDPLKPDTDGDGLNDRDEVDIHRTDPLLKDTDGDALHDGEEVRKHGTNPSEKDTDRDGLDDGSEIAKGTNPKAADTDGDGLGDAEEVSEYRTDPSKADTDADGLSDGDEIKRGTSPIRADTDADSWKDSVDMAPLNAFIPNALAIVPLLAVVALAAWRVLARRRRAPVSPTVEATTPSRISPARVAALEVKAPTPPASQALGPTAPTQEIVHPAGTKYCIECGELIPEVASYCPRCASKQE